MPSLRTIKGQGWGTLDSVLAELEMESWRFPVREYNAIFSGPVGRTAPMQWRLVEQQAA
jgi:hypothetical protein